MALSGMKIVGKGVVGEKNREVGQDKQDSEIYVKGLDLILGAAENH